MYTSTSYDSCRLANELIAVERHAFKDPAAKRNLKIYKHDLACVSNDDLLKRHNEANSMNQKMHCKVQERNTPHTQIMSLP